MVIALVVMVHLVVQVVVLVYGEEYLYQEVLVTLEAIHHQKEIMVVLQLEILHIHQEVEVELVLMVVMLVVVVLELVELVQLHQ